MKRAIITGAYGAIGEAIAKGLAHHGFDLMLVGRNEPKLQRVTTGILRIFPDASVDYSVVDLSREKEIRSFAKSWEGPLHALINNAVTAPRTRGETPEGIERQWATNVLGYYWMMQAFAPCMKGQPNARIVNVASYWAGGLDLSDPEFTTRQYTNDSAYRQSKQADRMLTAYCATTLKPDGITVNACHPGDVNSTVSNNLGFSGHETPEQGADTPVWLASSAEVEEITGAYFEHRKKEPCPFMNERALIKKLVERCTSYR